MTEPQPSTQKSAINGWAWFAIGLDVIAFLGAGPFGSAIVGMVFGLGGALLAAFNIANRPQRSVPIVALIGGVVIGVICIVRLIYGGMNG